MDSQEDPGLLKLLHEAQEVVSAVRDESEEEAVRALARYVADYFGSEQTRPGMAIESVIADRRILQGSDVVRLSDLQGLGLSRHRAILLKYLCDRTPLPWTGAPVPCRLVRGGLGPHQSRVAVGSAVRPPPRALLSIAPPGPSSRSSFIDDLCAVGIGPDEPSLPQLRDPPRGGSRNTLFSLVPGISFHSGRASLDLEQGQAMRQSSLSPMGGALSSHTALSSSEQPSSETPDSSLSTRCQPPLPPPPPQPQQRQRPVCPAKESSGRSAWWLESQGSMVTPSSTGDLQQVAGAPWACGWGAAATPTPGNEDSSLYGAGALSEEESEEEASRDGSNSMHIGASPAAGQCGGGGGRGKLGPPSKRPSDGPSRWTVAPRGGALPGSSSQAALVTARAWLSSPVPPPADAEGSAHRGRHAATSLAAALSPAAASSPSPDAAAALAPAPSPAELSHVPSQLVLQMPARLTGSEAYKHSWNVFFISPEDDKDTDPKGNCPAEPAAFVCDTTCAVDGRVFLARLDAPEAATYWRKMVGAVLALGCFDDEGPGSKESARGGADMGVSGTCPIEVRSRLAAATPVLTSDVSTAAHSA